MKPYRTDLIIEAEAMEAGTAGQPLNAVGQQKEVKGIAVKE